MATNVLRKSESFDYRMQVAHKANLKPAKMYIDDFTVTPDGVEVNYISEAKLYSNPLESDWKEITISEHDLADFVVRHGLNVDCIDGVDMTGEHKQTEYSTNPIEYLQDRSNLKEVVRMYVNSVVNRKPF